MPSANSPDSSRRSRGERTRKKPKGWSAFEISSWMIRIVSILLIIGLPWYYGCATWLGQYYLFLASVVLVALVAAHCIIGGIQKKGDLRIPMLSWVFWGLSGLALAQSLNIFSWQGESSWPPSVPLQRWALGIAPQPSALSGTLLVPGDVDASAQGIPCDLQNVPAQDQKLAWSIEPLHTQAALYSMFLCGMLVWVGRMVFGDPNKQLWLFGTLTVIGVAIACVGIHGAVSYRAENFLGLRTGASFATFVSKNSAGGFYNICIAGCLGLLGWTLLHTQRKTNDLRYRFPDSSWMMKIKGAFEDLLADLNTPQIASMLCLVTVVAALLISQCRGAALSSLAALVGSVLIANAKNRNRGAWVSTVAITLATIASLVVFQVDSEAYARLESISEFDVEEDLKTGRGYIWSVAWQAANYYGLLGSGLGTFHFAYLPFQDPSTVNWYYHAESLYAQCSVELGWIGLIVLVLALMSVVSNVQTRVPAENWKVAFPAKLAGAYLIFSQAIHSFVDFAIIIPALFVPAALLIGSVQGVIRHSLYLPPAKRKAEKPSDSESESRVRALDHPPVPIRDGLIGIGICLVAIACMFFSVGAAASQARADAMQKWTKAENAKAKSDRDQARLESLVNVWTNQSIAAINEPSILETPNALRSLADAMVYEYRANQLGTSDLRANPESWSYTSPLVIQLGLAAEKNPVNREQLIKLVGGPPALELLRDASENYAKAHVRSPLDWRLATGRTISNLTCSRAEMTPLVPAASQLARHSSLSLFSMSMMFRSHLNDEGLDRIRFQTMKSNIQFAVPVAKAMANEMADEEISVDLFPQRLDIIQNIATTVFTRDKFPKANLAFWERAKKLVDAIYMSEFDKALWLEKYAESIGDKAARIGYLRLALKKSMNNVAVVCRLANLLLDNGDIDEAELLFKQAQDTSPRDDQVKKLKERLAKIGE